VPRDQHEAARDIARSFSDTEAFEQSRRERKKIEMRFAHLKRILRLGRLRLRGPRGAQDEFVLAAIAQNLRRLASLVARPPPAQALPIAWRSVESVGVAGPNRVAPSETARTTSSVTTVATKSANRRHRNVLLDHHV